MTRSNFASIAGGVERRRLHREGNRWNQPLEATAPRGHFDFHVTNGYEWPIADSNLSARGPRQIRGSPTKRTSEQTLIEALINERMARQLFEQKVARLERQLRQERRERNALQQQIGDLQAARPTGDSREIAVFGSPKRSRPIELQIVGRRRGAPLIVPADGVD